MSAKAGPEHVISLQFRPNSPPFLKGQTDLVSPPFSPLKISTKEKEETGGVSLQQIEEMVSKAVLAQVSQAKVELAEMNAVVSRELNAKIIKNSSRLRDLQEFCKKIMEFVQDNEGGQSAATEELKEKIDQIEIKSSKCLTEAQTVVRKIESRITEELDREDYNRTMAIETLERRHKEQMGRTLEKALAEMRATWDERITGLFEQIVGRISTVETKITSNGLLNSTLETSDERAVSKGQSETLKVLEKRFSEFAEGFHSQIEQLQREIEKRDTSDTIFILLRKEVKEQMGKKAEQSEIDTEIRPYFKQIIQGMSELTAGVEEVKRMASGIDKECCARAADLRRAIADSEKRSKNEILEKLSLTHSQSVSGREFDRSKANHSPGNYPQYQGGSEINYTINDLAYSNSPQNAEFKRHLAGGSEPSHDQRSPEQMRGNSQNRWQNALFESEVSPGMKADEEDEVVSGLATRDFREHEFSKPSSQKRSPWRAGHNEMGRQIGIPENVSEGSEEFSIRQLLAKNSPHNSAGVCKFELKTNSPLIGYKPPNDKNEPFSKNKVHFEQQPHKKEEAAVIDGKFFLQENLVEPAPENENEMVEMLMDEEGYLVDPDGRKILDDNGMPIKLSDEQIEGLGMDGGPAN